MTKYKIKLNPERINEGVFKKLSNIEDISVIKRKYNALKEYYSNKIPINVLRNFYINPHYDYVFENLKTHNSNKLLKHLISKFNVFNIKELNDNRQDKRFLKLMISSDGMSGDEIKKFIESDKFINAVGFYNYYISYVNVGCHQ